MNRATPFRSSWPGLSQPSLTFFAQLKTWMPGTKPGMTGVCESMNEPAPKEERA